MPTIRTLALAAALLASAASAQAALVSRGGGMIYDTTLNLTWLADMNYAKTSGYDSDGKMTWSQADAWASNLSYGGFDDWRLPTMVDTGAAGCDLSYAGGSDCGFNVQTRSGSTVYSEMADLYYETLGNLAYCPPGNATCAGGPQTGWSLTNTGPFTNMQAQDYWSGLEYAPRAGRAWYFGTFDGGQNYALQDREHYAMAVRLGDVAAAVPEPQTWALVTLALGAAMLARRRRPA